MEYIYAAMLLHKAKKEINEANVKKVLDAAGVSVDPAKVKALVAALDGVNIEEVVKNASVVSVSQAPSQAAEKPAAAQKKEEKKEEKKSEEEAAAGLGALFG